MLLAAQTRNAPLRHGSHTEYSEIFRSLNEKVYSTQVPGITYSLQPEAFISLPGSGVATGGGGGNQENEGENQGKEEKSERKDKNQEGSFTLPLLTDRAGYTTTARPMVASKQHNWTGELYGGTLKVYDFISKKKKKYHKGTCPKKK